METLGDRVLRRRKALKLTQAKLAELSGIGQAFVSKLERNTARATTEILPLAKALQCNPHWLDTGEPPEGFFENGANVKELQTAGKVPLISWVKAGMWSDVEDPFHPGEADAWTEAYGGSVSSRAFALKVEGDSMTSQYPGDKISFPEGTIIIVDPERAANPGDFVVAKDVVSQQATFKRLMYDGGRWFLKPINPAYATQEIDDPGIRVIGRVMEYQINHKL